MSTMLARAGLPAAEIEIRRDTGSLEAEWWDLWRRDPRATPFQSPAWLMPWREQFCDGESLVVTVRREGRLTGLVPLFRHEGRLLLWGAGTSDWLDGVFALDFEPAELTAAFAEIGEPLDFFQLPADSPLLRAPVPAGWTERCAPSESCLVLPLPARLPPSMGQNLRYYRRRAERAGVSGPERAGPNAFGNLVELHKRRWNAHGEPGVLDDWRVLAWHRAALPQLDAAGLLRLYVMRKAGTVVAALYALAARDRLLYYISGFNPDLAPLGLGTVLIGHAVREAEREGAQSFDFLRGAEAYKFRWGAGEQPSFARSAFPPSA